MSNSRRFQCGLVIGFSLLMALSCKVQQSGVAIYNQYSLSQLGPAWGALWHQKGSEYKALCFQAYNLGRMRLDILLNQSYNKPTAIVTDIDETILDNSPYTVHQSLRNLGYSDSSWMKWTSMTACDTIPGALSFLRYAKSRGVSIFYITNRMEKERESTLKNLQKWNFPDASDGHLLLKNESSGKESRRQIVMQTHEILLLFGDNLSDFSAVFDKKPYTERNVQVENDATMFGSRFIVLPNAMYGDWEGALYGFDHRLNTEQKDSIIKKTLKQY
jgi:5'-nucleotidase (lipoprotein e(P4) family)